jgi:membrane fusion protein (multidrug efflux system)
MPKALAFEVEIVLSDGSSYPYKGSINFADPSFSSDTGSFQVRAVLPNPKHVLRPGMFVTAFLKGAMRPHAIVVPQLAVQMGAKGHLVYVVTAAGVAELRPVVVGDYQGEKDIVVVSGLAAGDRVVVEGVMGVVPGQPVQIVPSGASASSPVGTAASAGAAKK